MFDDRDLDRPICVQCWHPFTPATGNQKYCSVDCREDNRKQKILDRPCRRCGERLGEPVIHVHPECRKNTFTRKRNQWRIALTEKDQTK